jgi:hypothetical protein
VCVCVISVCVVCVYIIYVHVCVVCMYSIYMYMYCVCVFMLFLYIYMCVYISFIFIIILQSSKFHSPISVSCQTAVTPLVPIYFSPSESAFIQSPFAPYVNINLQKIFLELFENLCHLLFYILSIQEKNPIIIHYSHFFISPFILLD